MSDVIGYLPNGKIAFRSRNLRGLITYGRKHGITRAEIGDSVDGRGLYKVTFGNGATCEGSFADPRVMLGFFINRGFVTEIECDRHTFNHGSTMGRITVPFLSNIGRDGSVRIGPWIATAFRDENQTPLVRFVRS